MAAVELLKPRDATRPAASRSKQKNREESANPTRRTGARIRRPRKGGRSPPCHCPFPWHCLFSVIPRSEATLGSSARGQARQSPSRYVPRGKLPRDAHSGICAAPCDRPSPTKPQTTPNPTAGSVTPSPPFRHGLLPACDSLYGSGAGPVAQLDRASPSEGEGRTFESCRVRHRSGISADFPAIRAALPYPSPLVSSLATAIQKPTPSECWPMQPGRVISARMSAPRAFQMCRRVIGRAMWVPSYENRRN
jgi:hypothetical protein